MLSVALPQAQLTAVTIAQARTVMAVMISKLARLITRGQHKRQAYDDNAVGGIVEDTAHGCDDKQACAAHWAAMPSLWRSAHRVFKVK